MLRILLFQQNFVRILILQQNFVSNRHHYLHLPLSRNQTSASNFVFAGEYCQNSDILREFFLKQTSLSTSTLVSKIKILHRILFSKLNFDKILISQQNFVSLSTPTLVSKSKFCVEFCFCSRIL